jgi:hypothetical protein
MNFPCNALVKAHSLITIHPCIMVPYLSLLNAGDHLFDIFFGYLFDGEEKNSLHHMWRNKGFKIKVFQKCCKEGKTCLEFIDKC